MADCKGCETCAHPGAWTEDGEGNRMVDCELNELQMYQPAVTDYDCKHWERARGEG